MALGFNLFTNGRFRIIIGGGERYSRQGAQQFTCFYMQYSTFTPD